MDNEERNIIKTYLIKNNRVSETKRILSDISQLNTEINRTDRRSVFQNWLKGV